MQGTFSTRKTLTHIPAVSPQQIAFGAKLGLDLSGCTVGVARAHIEAAISREFEGVEPKKPTPRQIELAGKFGWEIANLPRPVGEAVITDLMNQLNWEAIDSESLKPGTKVRNIHDSYEETYVISSIQKDGIVFFKGGNGRKAYARSLRRVYGE